MQIIKIVFLFIILFFLLSINQNTPQQKELNPLFENNFFVKGICTIASPLIADLYWINSAKVSENNLKRKNIDEFFWADTISTFDPYFLMALRYYATYFARVENNISKALKIIDNAKKQNKKERYLYELEFALVIDFKNQIDKEAILKDLKWLLKITKEKSKKEKILKKIEFVIKM